MIKHLIPVLLIFMILSGCADNSVRSTYVDRYSRQELLNHKADADTSAKTLEKLRKSISDEAHEKSPEPSDSGDNVVSSKSSISVYITNTGTKYHTADCPHLKKSKNEISIEDAKAQNLEPCSTCNP